MTEQTGSSDTIVSVIICTHRRPDRLALALESLVREDYGGTDWEIIVIENDTAASDEVAAVVKRFGQNLPLRWFLETFPNLSRARNRGAEEAKGDYLAYLDDDIEVVSGWLRSLLRYLREYVPDVCGGPSLALYRTPKPYWYKDEWATSYCRGDEPAVTTETFGGMNFIVKKSLVKALGGFDESLGMAGEKIAYAEEVELLLRARRANPDLLTMDLPAVAVRHEVRPEKMTIRWCIRSTWASARDCISAGITGSRMRTWPAIAKSGIRSTVRLLWKMPGLFITALADLFRPRRTVWRRYLKERMLPDAFTLFSAVHAAALRFGSKRCWGTRSR